jgi:hypothetical protein
MQYATCTADDTVWEALPFSQLEPSLVESKRLSLICAECGEFAWFRKESTHGHPAHFCARHDLNCSLRIEYVISDDQRNDATSAEDEIASGDTIIVRLDEEKGGIVAVPEVQLPPKDGQGSGGRTFVIKGGDREAGQHFTLRRILHRLVQSPKFRESTSTIVFYKNAEEVMVRGQVRDIVCGFEQISQGNMTDKPIFYWGPVASAKYAYDGKIWLNSGSQYGAASVAIFEDVASEFISLFDVDDLEELAGAYVLVAGRCQYSSEGRGKPIIWCGQPKYIFVRKYRAKNLQTN